MPPAGSGNHLIRPARSDDVPEITGLVRAAYAKWVPLIGREPLPMTADYGNAVSEHRVDVLCADAVIAGVLETMRRPDHIWIENVAVLPAYQGRGYGNRLLAYAEEIAGREGLNELRLLTNLKFAANIALYVSLGFIVDRQEPFGDGITVYMRKPRMRAGG